MHWRESRAGIRALRETALSDDKGPTETRGNGTGHLGQKEGDSFSQLHLIWGPRSLCLMLGFFGQGVVYLGALFGVFLETIH